MRKKKKKKKMVSEKKERQRKGLTDYYDRSQQAQHTLQGRR